MSIAGYTHGPLQNILWWARLLLAWKLEYNWGEDEKRARSRPFEYVCSYNRICNVASDNTRILNVFNTIWRRITLRVIISKDPSITLSQTTFMTVYCIPMWILILSCKCTHYTRFIYLSVCSVYCISWVHSTDDKWNTTHSQKCFYYFTTLLREEIYIS